MLIDVQMAALDSVEGVPGLDGHAPGYALWLTLLQNQEQRTVEMLLSFGSEAERGRWVEAVTPATPATDTATGDRVYEQWDCPRVEVTAPPPAAPPAHPDLGLAAGDTANVLRKTRDGDESPDSDNIESSKL